MFSKSKLQWLIIIVIYAIFAFLVISRLTAGIIAGGESPIYINPDYINYFSFWDERINFGEQGIHQSNLVLFYLIWKFLKLFAFILHPSTAFILLSFFLPAVFFTYFLDQVLKFKNKFLYLPASLLFSFNVFRLLGPLNERQNLLFISLPLFCIFYYKLTCTLKWKYVFILVLLSFLGSSMGANLPVFNIPYLLILLIFLFYVPIALKQKKSTNFLLKTLAFISLSIMVNLFWIYSMGLNLLETYHNVGSGLLAFSALASGTFFDHFRFLGFWGWLSGHMSVPYYPFAQTYNQPLFIFTTYIVVAITIVGIFLVKKTNSNSQRIFNLFIVFLFSFSLMLLAGTKGPTAFIYSLLYNYAPLFRIYREPFAKFTPLFILASCYLFTIAIYFLANKFNRYIRTVIILTASCVILLNAYPFFNGEAMPVSKWMGGNTGYLMDIPDYWNQLKLDVETDLVDRKIAVFPFNPYSGNHLWLKGASMVGNMADYLLRNNTIKASAIDDSNSGKRMKNIFQYEKGIDLNKYLGLLNSKYVLQMNDFDWRYAQGKMLPPSKSNSYLQSSKLGLVKNYGQITTEFLQQIDYDPDKSMRDELISELSDRPALSLYKISTENFVPHIYVPKQTLLSSNKAEVLGKIAESKEIEWPIGVYFAENDTNQVFQFSSDKQKVIRYGDNTLPQIEFRKINSTKYRVIVHKATKLFPLVFLESFHNKWKLYSGTVVNADSLNTQQLSNYKLFSKNEDEQATLSEINEYISKGWISSLGDGETKYLKTYQFVNNVEKIIQKIPYQVGFISKNIHGTIQNDNLPSGRFNETWLKTSLTKGADHIMINGFANSWMVNPQILCGQPGVCIKNSDGSTDMELIIEFWPQRLLWSAFAISLAVFVVTVSLTVWTTKTDK